VPAGDFGPWLSFTFQVYDPHSRSLTLSKELCETIGIAESEASQVIDAITKCTDRVAAQESTLAIRKEGGRDKYQIRIPAWYEPTGRLIRAEFEKEIFSTLGQRRAEAFYALSRSRLLGADFSYFGKYNQLWNCNRSPGTGEWREEFIATDATGKEVDQAFQRSLPDSLKPPK
jgi:hypothetical protein